MKFYAAGILACALLASFAAAQSATAQAATDTSRSDASAQATNPPIPVPPVPFASSPPSPANSTGTYLAGNWTYPGPDEAAADYPAGAQAAEIEGRVTLDCQVAATGKLIACDVIAENPPGYGFGSATVELFMSAAHVDPASVPGGIPAGARKKFTYAWLLG